LPAQPGWQDAGVNRFPRFLLRKNLKAKIATEGDFRPRKG
jgi:hypothetical protein